METNRAQSHRMVSNHFEWRRIPAIRVESCCIESNLLEWIIVE